jgi:hypothetical protein
MLGKFVLMVAQLAAGWHLGLIAMEYVPFYPRAPFDIFVYAVVFAVIVWIIGFIGSAVLRDCGTPTSPTLTMALIMALVGAALALLPDWSYVRQYTPQLGQTIKSIPYLWMPLGGAVIGYLIKEH